MNKWLVVLAELSPIFLSCVISLLVSLAILGLILLNSYIQSQTTRKLPLFHGDLPITEMHRGRERTSYIPFLLNLETRLDVILIRILFVVTFTIILYLLCMKLDKMEWFQTLFSNVGCSVGGHALSTWSIKIAIKMGCSSGVAVVIGNLFRALVIGGAAPHFGNRMAPSVAAEGASGSPNTPGQPANVPVQAPVAVANPPFDLNRTASPNPELCQLMDQLEKFDRKLDMIMNKPIHSKDDVLSNLHELEQIKTRFDEIEIRIQECLSVDRVRQKEEACLRAEVETMARQIDPAIWHRFEEQQARRRAFQERLPLLEQERMAQFNRDRGRNR